MKNKKKIIAIAAGVAILLLLAAVFVLTPLLSLSLTLREMTQGTAFEISYQMDADALEGENEQAEIYSFLDMIGMSEGVIWGQFTEDAAYLTVAKSRDGEPVSEIYKNTDETYVNVAMLYTDAKGNVTAEHPLIGALMPEWGGGTYLTVSQFEEITGIMVKNTMPDVNINDFISWTDFTRVNYEEGETGYVYFKLKEGIVQNYDVIAGVKKEFLFGDDLQVNLIFTEQQNAAKMELNADLTVVQEAKLEMPTDILSEEETENLKIIWNVCLKVINALGYTLY